jgi:hypothetical protein
MAREGIGDVASAGPKVERQFGAQLVRERSIRIKGGSWVNSCARIASGCGQRRRVDGGERRVSAARSLLRFPASV